MIKQKKWWYHPDSDVILDVPLWQQAFDWILDRYKLFGEIKPDSVGVERSNVLWSYRIIEIGRNNSKDNLHYYQWGTYNTARQACLEKLIELCENKI